MLEIIIGLFLVLVGLVLLFMIGCLFFYSGAILTAPIWSLIGIFTGNDKKAAIKLFLAVIFAFASIALLAWVLTL